jgi:hypothetical protein
MGRAEKKEYKYYKYFIRDFPMYRQKVQSILIRFPDIAEEETILIPNEGKGAKKIRKITQRGWDLIMKANDTPTPGVCPPVDRMEGHTRVEENAEVWISCTKLGELLGCTPWYGRTWILSRYIIARDKIKKENTRVWDVRGEAHRFFNKTGVAGVLKGSKREPWTNAVVSAMTPSLLNFSGKLPRVRDKIYLSFLHNTEERGGKQ